MFSEYRSGNQYDTRIRKANTNLYVKNFDSDLSEGDLCRMFESYGRITSCEVSESMSKKIAAFFNSIRSLEMTMIDPKDSVLSISKNLPWLKRLTF